MFSQEDLGELKYFVAGPWLPKNCLYACQWKHVLDILTKFGMPTCTPSPFKAGFQSSCIRILLNIASGGASYLPHRHSPRVNIFSTSCVHSFYARNPPRALRCNHACVFEVFKVFTK